jgi:hypothetical protein
VIISHAKNKGKPNGRKMEEEKLKKIASADQLITRFHEFVKSIETVMAKHLRTKMAKAQKKCIPK